MGRGRVKHQIPGQVWLFYFKNVHGKIHKPDIHVYFFNRAVTRGYSGHRFPPDYNNYMTGEPPISDQPK